MQFITKLRKIYHAIQVSWFESKYTKLVTEDGKEEKEDWEVRDRCHCIDQSGEGAIITQIT